MPLVGVGGLTLCPSTARPRSPGSKQLKSTLKGGTNVSSYPQICRENRAYSTSTAERYQVTPGFCFLLFSLLT